MSDPNIIVRRTFQECLERGHDDPVAFAEDFLEIRPHDGQKKWLRSHAHAKERMLHCANRWGKDLDIATPIPTPTGWVTMGDIKIGAFVFDETGKPCRVVAATDVMRNRPCYDVVFSDGTVITAGDTHEWVTWTGHETPAVVTTEEIHASLRADAGNATHSVKVAEPLQLPDAALPIDAYRLGSWLGSGAGERSRIPVAYLRASPSQRLALLQGLMETGGHAQEGHCEMSLTHRALAQSVVELLCTLGIAPTLTVERACYRIRFTTGKPEHRAIVDVRPRPSVPTRCIQVDSPSHLYLCGRTFIPTHNSMIAGVKLLHHAFYQIRDPKYALTPTGAIRPYICSNIAMSMDQARIAWDNAYMFATNSPRFARFVEDADHSPFPVMYIANEGRGKDKLTSEIWARSTAKRAKYLLGKHFAFINYDEAAFDADGEAVWNEVLRMRLADEAGSIDFTSTPNLKNWFYAQCEKGKIVKGKFPKRYYTQKGSTFENPNVDHDFIRETMKYMTDVQRQQNVYGEFADASSVFDVRYVEECYKDNDYFRLMPIPANHEIVYTETDEGVAAKLKKASGPCKYVIGADLARKRDNTCIAVLRVDAQPAQLVYFHMFSRTTWKTIYDEIVKAHSMYNNAPVLIDSTGMGDSPLETLKSDPYNLPVAGYNFAGSGREKESLIMHLQEAIQNKRIIFPFIRELYDQLIYYDWNDKKLETDALFGLALAWECALQQASTGMATIGDYEIMIAVSGMNRMTGMRYTSLDRERQKLTDKERDGALDKAIDDMLNRYNAGEDLEDYEYSILGAFA